MIEEFQSPAPFSHLTNQASASGLTRRVELNRTVPGSTVGESRAGCAQAPLEDPQLNHPPPLDALALYEEMSREREHSQVIGCIFERFIELRVSPSSPGNDGYFIDLQGSCVWTNKRIECVNHLNTFTRAY